MVLTVKTAIISTPLDNQLVGKPENECVAF